MKKQKKIRYRKRWFGFLKNIMRIFIKKSEFIYLGEQLGKNGIVLSNHVGTSAPLAFELYGPQNIRFWGAYEMNSGLIKLYKYQTRVYYHEKKHWNLFLARLFCLIASPLTYIFYKGLRLINTYPDSRLRKTLSESTKALEDGYNVIIFPEDSTKGYLDELEGFHAGFVLLMNMCAKKGLDVPVYVSYYKKSEKRYIIDNPVMLSKLLDSGEDKDAIAKKLCDRCNELGKMHFETGLTQDQEDEIEKII